MAGPRPAEPPPTGQTHSSSPTLTPSLPWSPRPGSPVRTRGHWSPEDPPDQVKDLHPVWDVTQTITSCSPHSGRLEAGPDGCCLFVILQPLRSESRASGLTGTLTGWDMGAGGWPVSGRRRRRSRRCSPRS